MFQDTLVFDSEALRDSFALWQSEQDQLEAEWNESLAALAAYQSHLDRWQQDLHAARSELRREQKAFERKQIDAEKQANEAAAQIEANLAAANERIALTSQQLLARTEELRQLDMRRAELATELEASRAQNASLATELEQQKKSLEQERAAWADQLRHMRELIDARPMAPVTGYDDVVRPADRPAPAAAPPARAPKASGDRTSTNNNPVLGSIVEQFGKLRQQRASDRQTGKKPR